MTRALLVLACLAAALVLAGCGGGRKGGDESYRAPPVQTVDEADLMRGERAGKQHTEPPR